MKPLNPIMAVLVIASVGASPLRTLAADGTSAPAAATEDKNPLNAMSRILSENPSARADAGKRMEEFLLDADGSGKSFVKDGVDRKALGAVAREWTEKAPAGSVAVLYFVVGPGLSAPGWALKDPILSKTFASGMKWEGRLRETLADWTGKSQIDKTKEKTQAAAFLTEAATKAAAVFADQRTKKEIDDSILANDTSAPAVPDTRRGAGSRLDGAARQYTLADLYLDGAVVKDVSGPQDANSRRISMKIYTKRMPDGTMRNEIGIFDITDTNDIFGQRFPIDSGKQSFTLDDRTGGHKKYELSFGQADAKGNRTITFARPGDGGAPLTTSVAELFTLRAEHAATMGNIVKVGGEEFYTLPQGGARSALALFPKSVIDARGSGDHRDLVPALYAEVGLRGPDGRNQNVAPGEKGGPHLGKVGDKEFHLVFNKTLGVWEVADGPGDLPKPPAPPTSGGGAANPGGANPGGNPGGNPSNDGSVSLADLETLTMREFEAKQGSCKKNPDDIKDLADSLKGNYGILTCEDPVEGKSQTVLVPKSAEALDQRFRYRNSKGLLLKRARFYDHYLVLVFDKQVQYLDLLKFEKDAEGTASFAMSGYIDEKKNAAKFVDAKALSDALRYYMGVTGEDAAAVDEVPKRVARVLPGKAYNLSGGIAGSPKAVLVVVAISGGLQYNIWPTIIMPGNETVPKPNPYEDLVGPSNAMGGDVSSDNKPFDASFETAEKRKAVLIGTQQAAEENDIALYATEDPIKKDSDAEKKYYVMFRYRSPSPKDVAIFRHKQIEVFNKDNPYPGDGLKLSGLVKAGAVVASRGSAGYKFVSGTTKEKGVFALFQNKQVSGTNAQKGAANCAGPLIWWGLADRPAAQKVCEDDKF
ncbi:MAG: hypothetical protein HYV14_03190 [Elusimicrobia bacterium]|nr:hypothetical protein [Elusimicrobiota bacterium]